MLAAWRILPLFILSDLTAPSITMIASRVIADAPSSGGLLSRVAAAIFRQDVQVHNARIATFGERVEDTFLVSDARHRPLTTQAMDALAGAIRTHLDQG